jgi:hypothetical protein
MITTSGIAPIKLPDTEEEIHICYSFSILAPASIEYMTLYKKAMRYAGVPHRDVGYILLPTIALQKPIASWLD